MQTIGWFKILAVMVSVGAIASARGQHEGDLIYAIRNGRCEIISPTNVSTQPPFQWMNYFDIPTQDPGIFSTNFGWDYWPTNGNGLTVVGQARITPVGISPQIKVRSGNLSFFSPGATNPTYLLINNQRHKHFNFEVNAISPEDAIYGFSFKFTEVKDTAGNSFADSPVYHILMAPDWSSWPSSKKVQIRSLAEEFAWLAD